VMAHGDEREGEWRGNWWMEWVVSTLHTTSEYGLSSITTADAHTSATSSRLNWRPRRFKWTRPFRWKTKSGFCVCAITFQTQSTYCCRLMKTALTLVVVAQRNVRPLGVYQQYTTYSSQIQWGEVQLCLVRVSQYCYFPLCSSSLKLCINLSSVMVQTEHVTSDDQ
jgi:hypothetical protein